MNIELIREKWEKTGLLRFVKPENIEIVVVRLENAAMLSQNMHSSKALENEIRLLNEQNLLGGQVEKPTVLQPAVDAESQDTQELLTLVKRYKQKKTLEQFITTVKTLWNVA
jgi:transposase